MYSLKASRSKNTSFIGKRLKLRHSFHNTLAFINSFYTLLQFFCEYRIIGILKQGKPRRSRMIRPSSKSKNRSHFTNARLPLPNLQFEAQSFFLQFTS